MTDPTGAPQPKSSPEDPPAWNQAGDEPVPTTPDESAQAGDAGDDDAISGSTGAGHEQVSEAADEAGEVNGVPVAGTYAAGQSGSGPSDGGVPVIASGGKPDGEVSTGA